MNKYGKTLREEEDRLVGEQRGKAAPPHSVGPAVTFQQW